MGELNIGRMLDRCRMYSDRPAVHDLGSGYQANYGEHLDRVERLCSAIADLGVGPTDRIAVLAGASHIYVELWRSALAGAAVINPLNTRLAPDELVYILNDSGAEVLFVDAESAVVVPELRLRVPQLRSVVLIGDGGPEMPCDVRLDELMATVSAAGLPDEPDDDAVCVLMYTGGTTGLPKGVVLTQAAVVLCIYRMQMGLGYGPERYLSFMPMFHIASIYAWGTFLPHGGLTVVQPAFEPGGANAAIRDHAISSVLAVPTMLALMLQHPDYTIEMLSSLRSFGYGAAPMPPELLDTMMAAYPHVEFFQLYGMTECPSVTGLLAEDHRVGGEILRSVGRPLPGCSIDIRHPETGEPVPIGEVGEIYVRSGSMLLQYWNLPDPTAAAIVDGWYRSGDAGRVDAEGYVFLADRVKDMIISGGENIYSLEVENAISSHPEVREVAVVAKPDPTWGEIVHAFVVCDEGAVTAAQLDAHARESIAGYKVPRSWSFQADPLPASAAGKILKRALRDLVRQA